MGRKNKQPRSSKRSSSPPPQLPLLTTTLPEPEHLVVRENNDKCSQCGAHFSTTKSRKVTMSCGHEKCRSCAGSSEKECKQCTSATSTNTITRRATRSSTRCQEAPLRLLSSSTPTTSPGKTTIVSESETRSTINLDELAELTAPTLEPFDHITSEINKEKDSKSRKSSRQQGRLRIPALIQKTLVHMTPENLSCDPVVPNEMPVLSVATTTAAASTLNSPSNTPLRRKGSSVEVKVNSKRSKRDKSQDRNRSPDITQGVPSGSDSPRKTKSSSSSKVSKRVAALPQVIPRKGGLVTRSRKGDRGVEANNAIETLERLNDLVTGPVKNKKKEFLIPEYIKILPPNSSSPTMYQCGSCQKKFKTKGHIKYHKFCSGGNNDKPFHCEQCGQGFIAKSHYVYHLRTHSTGERPYACPKCGKQFNQKFKVTRHMRSHRGESSKSLICPECNRTFANAEALRSHGLVHTGGKPFKCLPCGIGFRRKLSLDSHLVNSHTQQPENNPAQLSQEASTNDDPEETTNPEHEENSNNATIITDQNESNGQGSRDDYDLNKREIMEKKQGKTHLDSMKVVVPKSEKHVKLMSSSICDFKAHDECSTLGVATPIDSDVHETVSFLINQVLVKVEQDDDKDFDDDDNNHDTNTSTLKPSNSGLYNMVVPTEKPEFSERLSPDITKLSPFRRKFEKVLADDLESISSQSVYSPLSEVENSIKLCIATLESDSDAEQQSSSSQVKATTSNIYDVGAHASPSSKTELTFTSAITKQAPCHQSLETVTAGCSVETQQLTGQSPPPPPPKRDQVSKLPTNKALATAKGKPSRLKQKEPGKIPEHVKILESTGTDDPPLFQCTTCQKKFKTKGHIKYHKFCAGGNSDKPFHCDQCGQGFIAKSHYVYHLRTHTGERPYACPKCDKRFNQRFKVKRHLRSHTGEKPFVCEECSRGFSNTQALVSHILVHTGERPFPCSSCNKRFRSMATLRRHKVIHIDERPFGCSFCDKRFKLKSSLALHRSTHSSERPFNCDRCSRAFHHKRELLRHQVIHSGERPFKCFLCGTSFRRVDNLNRHIVKTHCQSKETAKQLSDEAAINYAKAKKQRELLQQDNNEQVEEQGIDEKDNSDEPVANFKDDHVDDETDNSVDPQANFKDETNMLPDKMAEVTNSETDFPFPTLPTPNNSITSEEHLKGGVTDLNDGGRVNSICLSDVSEDELFIHEENSVDGKSESEAESTPSLTCSPLAPVEGTDSSNFNTQILESGGASITRTTEGTDSPAFMPPKPKVEFVLPATRQLKMAELEEPRTYDPSEIHIVQPNGEKCCDSNYKLIYAAAAATAERDEGVESFPNRVKLLYAEALGVVNNPENINELQFYYTAAAPDQHIVRVSPPLVQLMEPHRVNAGTSTTNATNEVLQYSVNPCHSSPQQNHSNIEEQSRAPTQLGHTVHTTCVDGILVSHIHRNDPSQDELLNKAKDILHLFPENALRYCDWRVRARDDSNAHEETFLQDAKSKEQVPIPTPTYSNELNSVLGTKPRGTWAMSGGDNMPLADPAHYTSHSHTFEEMNTARAAAAIALVGELARRKRMEELLQRNVSSNTQRDDHAQHGQQIGEGVGMNELTTTNTNCQDETVERRTSLHEVHRGPRKYYLSRANNYPI